MTFTKVSWPVVAKLVVAIAPILGLSGLAFEQNKEIQRLTTTVVIEQDPIEVHVEQAKQHSHAHNHKQIDENKESVEKVNSKIDKLTNQLKELTRWQ